MCYILHWPIVSKSGIGGAHIQYYYCNKLVKSWLENMMCLELRMNACGALVVCFSIELLDFVARLRIYQLRWTHTASHAFILVSKHTLFKQKTKLIRFRILVSWVLFCIKTSSEWQDAGEFRPKWYTWLQNFSCSNSTKMIHSLKMIHHSKWYTSGFQTSETH